MTHENFTHIQIKKEIKEKLDKLRFNLQVKLKQPISQNRMVDILINDFKENKKIKKTKNKIGEKEK